MGPPGGILMLSGFCAVICAGRNIVLGCSVDPSAIPLRRSEVLSFKVFFLNFTQSNSALAPSRQSFDQLHPAYSRLGPMSSAAEGKWSHFQSQFEIHPPCKW